jgi:hypothetical protein
MIYGSILCHYLKAVDKTDGYMQLIWYCRQWLLNVPKVYGQNKPFIQNMAVPEGCTKFALKLLKPHGVPRLIPKSA